ncbi:hypothetical protein RchiOBHm_Chr3g0480741 [Rosa chinensis]|uniref:Uncharacterized protein n=1 Tax=Rosa chinensis TaxID=74649 RepID=A0A2P6RDU3_ROSCH|nr:hypothetical protein RchiOBHm_Chr3g0480741 [Rosa chinensis]
MRVIVAVVDMLRVCGEFSRYFILVVCPGIKNRVGLHMQLRSESDQGIKMGSVLSHSSVSSTRPLARPDIVLGSLTTACVSLYGALIILD